MLFPNYPEIQNNDAELQEGDQGWPGASKCHGGLKWRCLDPKSSACPPRRGGDLSSARALLGIDNIICRPSNIINLKISLLYLVKYLINSALMPWQGQAK